MELMSCQSDVLSESSIENSGKMAPTTKQANLPQPPLPKTIPTPINPSMSSTHAKPNLIPHPPPQSVPPSLPVQNDVQKSGMIPHKLKSNQPAINQSLPPAAVPTMSSMPSPAHVPPSTHDNSMKYPLGNTIQKPVQDVNTSNLIAKDHPPLSLPPAQAPAGVLHQFSPDSVTNKSVLPPAMEPQSAIKKQAEIKMKNRNSWSNLAQAWGTKPTTSGGMTGNGAMGQTNSPQLPRPTNAAGSFETFKKQAEERKHMLSLLKEQEEQRKLKEQQEKERLRQEQERQKERAQVGFTETAARQLPPSAGNVDARKSKIARMREQQRLRRQQMSGQIDMNSQSDIMKTFEESLM